MGGIVFDNVAWTSDVVNVNNFALQYNPALSIHTRNEPFIETLWKTLSRSTEQLGLPLCKEDYVSNLVIVYPVGRNRNAIMNDMYQRRVEAYWQFARSTFPNTTDTNELTEREKRDVELAEMMLRKHHGLRPILSGNGCLG